MAQKKFKYVAEVVLTFCDKLPKATVKHAVQFVLEEGLINGLYKVRVRSVDLE